MWNMIEKIAAWQLTFELIFSIVYGLCWHCLSHFNRDTQMGDSPDLELISDLPQSIVESILTLLPIREAVTKDNHFVK